MDYGHSNTSCKRTLILVKLSAVNEFKFVIEIKNISKAFEKLYKTYGVKQFDMGEKADCLRL